MKGVVNIEAGSCKAIENDVATENTVLPLRRSPKPSCVKLADDNVHSDVSTCDVAEIDWRTLSLG